MLNSKLIQLTASLLATASALWALPTSAVTVTYRNDYRGCVARLLKAGITAEASAQACATALRPRELSSCVMNIQRKTEIPALDALSPCRQARRPDELASCVVGISTNTKDAANPEVLSYCGRSLLPVRFAQCVVGLRKEVDFAAKQLMDSCIDGSDRISGFAPPSQPTQQFQRTFETTPVPVNPGRN